LRIWTIVLGLGLLSIAPVTRAQEAPGGEIPTPPALGDVVIDDPLSALNLLQPSHCPSNRGDGEFVGEGYILKLTGRCREGDAGAALPVDLRRLTVPDGDLALEVKPVNGLDRVRLLISIRVQPDGIGAYVVAVEPSRGTVELSSISAGATVVLAQRDDLASKVTAGDWNRLAVRAQGGTFWVLLNDQPILTATDAAYATGGARVTLVRTGAIDDAAEAALVLRNLRVSALAAGDQARLPSRPSGPDPVQLVGALAGTPIEPGSLPSGFAVDQVSSSTELAAPAVGGVRLSFNGPPGTNGPGTIQPIYYAQTLTFIVYAAEADAQASFQLGNGAAAADFGAPGKCSTLELNMIAFDTGAAGKASVGECRVLAGSVGLVAASTRQADAPNIGSDTAVRLMRAGLAHLARVQH
jgi:hypothetical protein